MLFSLAGGYRIEINEAPFALKVFAGERLALCTAEGAGGCCRDGAWRNVTAVRELHEDDGVLTARCATTDPELFLCLTITPRTDGLTVCWRAEDGQLCETFRDAFDIASAGHWYGHGYHEPQHWPLERGGVANDPFLCNNVQSPIWLTSGGAGIVAPTEELLAVWLNHDGDGAFRLAMKNVAEFSYVILLGSDIADLFGKLLGVIGKPSRIPPRDVFAKPIYSTWTEHPRYLTQEKVLDFAHQIVNAGLPAGVLEIDEKYQPSFGEIAFDPAIFPDPAGMLAELRALGFQATLWTCPFINTDSPAFSELAAIGGLVRDKRTGEPGLFTWWGGQAGLLDVTSPDGERWYADHLAAMHALGFVGFKFDGGDGKYAPAFETADYHTPQRPQGYTNRYLEFIAHHYPEYSESRVAWMVQREGLITREGGKDTRWGLDNGLHALITQGMTQSVLGYPYLICDMVPGRVRTRFPDAPLPSDELFLRWVEASALTPILQFSYGPWHYGDTTLAAVRAYANFHLALGSYLYAAAEDAHRDGTPILRPLFLAYPADGETYLLDDEFLLGGDLLAAPVVTEGAVARDLYLPAGAWRDAWTGGILPGGQWLRDYPAPCPGIPLFIRVDGPWHDELLAACRAYLPHAQRGQVPSGVTTTTYSATLARTI